MSTLDKYLKYADNPTPKPEEGTWVLISPSGKRYEGDRPLKCVQEESNSRIPPEVALGRIARSMQDDSRCEHNVPYSRCEHNVPYSRVCDICDKDGVR